MTALETERGTRKATNGRAPSWKQTELGKVLTEAQYGLSLRGNSSGQYPILRMNCQVDGRVVFRDLQYVDLDDEAFRRFCLVDGDLLFNRTNSYELVGRTALYEGSRPAVFASYLIRLRVDTETIVPAFLNYFLNVNFTQAALKAFATKGVSQSNISASKLRTLTVPVPPVPVQRAIAGVLSKIQSAVQVQEKIVAGIRELKAATMAKLFREGLRGERRKQTEIGEIPKSWEVVPLVRLLREGLRNGHSAVASGDGTGVPTLTLTAVTRHEFTKANLKMTKADPERVADLWLLDGDILVERANTKEMVGLAAMYCGPSDFGIFPDLMIRVRVQEDWIQPRFVAEWLLTEWCRTYFQNRCRGAATSMPKIDHGVVEGVLVPVPPAAEQTEAVHFITSLEAANSAAAQRLAALRTLFSSTLHLLMTGQVRVPVSEEA